MTFSASTLDEALVTRHLTRNRLATGGGVVVRAKRLEAHYRSKTTDLAACTLCGGTSPCALAACPFCGEGGLTDAPAEAAPVAATPAAVEPAPVAPAPAPVPTTVLAVVEDGGLAGQVKIVRDAMRGAAGNLYQMGCALKRIHDGRLWAEIDPATARPLYLGFKQCIAGEFHLGHTYAYDLIAVVEKFSEADVLALGAGRLRLALKAPPDRRQEVEDAVRSGESRDDLRDRLRNLPGAAVSAGRVVVGLFLRQVVVPAFARPRAGFKGDPKPATSLNDEPWCSLDVENDVRLVVRLIRDVDGSLRFVVEAVKGAATEEPEAVVEAPGEAGGEAASG